MIKMKNNYFHNNKRICFKFTNESALMRLSIAHASAMYKRACERNGARGGHRGCQGSDGRRVIKVLVCCREGPVCRIK
jgi:hypothetical protein